MANRDHPSAKPAPRTVLNLGNLPPKRQGFGATNVSITACQKEREQIILNSYIPFPF